MSVSSPQATGAPTPYPSTAYSSSDTQTDRTPTYGLPGSGAQEASVLQILIRHAPHDVLLALRALSRTLRDRVDARLAEFLTITEVEGFPAAIRAPEGRVPPLRPIEGAVLRISGPPSPEYVLQKWFQLTQGRLQLLQQL